MAKYNTRIIKKRLTSRDKAESLVEKLQAQAEERKLSHQLRYKVKAYSIIRANWFS